MSCERCGDNFKFCSCIKDSKKEIIKQEPINDSTEDFYTKTLKQIELYKNEIDQMDHETDDHYLAGPSIPFSPIPILYPYQLSYKGVINDYSSSTVGIQVNGGKCHEAGETIKIRKFSTGASRDTDKNKLTYMRFFAPIVMKRFAEFMDKNRKMADGSYRDGDNWQKLFGQDKEHEDVCCDSLLRHVEDVWLINRGFEKEAREDLETALCSIIFNAQAWLFKLLKEKYNENISDDGTDPCC